jgi:ketosteroid isomerase-like protein
MKHPHVLLLEKLYADFNQGQFQKVLDACADSITFQVPGKSKLAGKYTKANFVSGLVTQLGELSGGSFQLEVHDILASDVHAAVLGMEKITRDGKTIEYRLVQVWRFENGKPVAWYQYPRDLYQYDAAWGL